MHNYAELGIDLRKKTGPLDVSIDTNVGSNCFIFHRFIDDKIYLNISNRDLMLNFETFEAC
jgi:hypothetical protein